MNFLLSVLGFTVALSIAHCKPHKDWFIPYDPKAILEDIAKATVSFPIPYYKPDVCYEHLGCFSKVNGSGTFPFLAVQPESPEIIKTEFHLYTRHNKQSPVELSYTDTNTLSTGFFDSSKRTIIIIHGFNEHAKKDWNLKMKNIFLELYDANVILLDWGNGAILPYYAQAVVNSELVGRQLAVLLELLQGNRELDIESVYVIGYSLGAHLAGFTGKTLFAKFGKKMARISGLDPAGPIFEIHGEDVHLSPADATYVDIIHTSSGGNIFFGELGISKPIGHVDFYPNGGEDQPDCGWFDFLVCSHRRAVLLFLESMSKSCQFQAFPCTSYQDYRNGKCNSCGAGCGLMGLPSIDNPARGSLYITTNTEEPYCKSADV